MSILSKKYAKQIVMFILACFIALCFTGCSSQSSELTKNGNFVNPPVRSNGLDVDVVGGEVGVLVPLVGEDISTKSTIPSPSITFTLVYLDSSKSPLFVDNVETSISTACFFSDDAFYKNSQKFGYPQYIQVYISQVEASQSGESNWGFSSEALGKMEDSDYLDATADALKENAIDCGVAQIR